MPLELHFICQHQQRWEKVGDNLYETGNWTVSKQVAQDAADGLIYLHEHQADPAWHGGRIVECRPSSERGRYVFRYRVDAPFRVTLTEGWGQEKAIVRRSSDVGWNAGDAA